MNLRGWNFLTTNTPSHKYITIMQTQSVLLLAGVISLATALPSGSSQKGKKYDMPLTWTPFGFTSPITLGTPPQTLSSFVDWTWNSLYVVTTKCLGKENNKDECLVPEQQYFNQSKSKTYKNLSAKYPSEKWNPNHFFFDLDLLVDYRQDIETIGRSSAPVRIQAADFQFEQEFEYPFGAVYGLSPVFPEQKSTLPLPRFTFYKQMLISL